MADLFSGIEQPAGPFDNVPLPESAEAPGMPSARFRRAQVVAAAKVDPLSDDVVRDFEAIQQNYMDTVNIYGEGQDELAAAETRVANQRRAIQELQVEAPRIDPTGELQRGAALAAQASIEEDIARQQKFALEQQAVDNIMDLAASGNRTQASLLLTLMETGDVMDQLRDNATKQLILQNEIDRLQDAAAAEPWFSKLTGFVLGAIPLQNSMSQSGLMDTEVRSIWDKFGDQIWAGERSRMEAASIWQLPPDQFRDALRNQVLPAIQGNSTFLGFRDRNEELNLLSRIQQTPSASETNFWNSIDNFTAIGVGEIVGASKIATSLPRMLVGLGARKQAAAQWAKGMVAAATEGTEEAVQKAGIGGLNDLTDGATPTIAKVEGPDMIVPLQAGANEGYANGLARISELEQILQTGRFATDAERQAAIDAFTERSKEAFGTGMVVDVERGKNVLADSSEINTLSFTLGQNANEGWATREAAENFAKSLGFSNARVVTKAGDEVPNPATSTPPPARTGPEPTAIIRQQIEGRPEDFGKDVYDALQRAGVKVPGRAYNVDYSGPVLDAAGRVITTPAAKKLVDKAGIGDAFVAGDLRARPTPLPERNLDEVIAEQVALKGNVPDFSTPQAQVVQAEGGQFFVKVQRNLPETAFWTNLDVKTGNAATRWLAGAVQRSDEFLFRRAQVSENARNKIINDWRRTIVKDLKIDPARLARVNQMWMKGNNESKWYSLDEANMLWRRAFNRDIDEKEWKAYNTLRDANDIEYAMRNDIRFKELVVKGYETASFNVRGQSFDSINAIIDDTLSRPIKARAFNEKTGTFVSKLKADDIEKLRNEGYVMLHFDEPIKMMGDKEAYSVIVKRDGMVRDSLKQTQLPYRAGGHRIYKDKYFAKQARKTIDEDGNEVWENPRTFMVGTQSEVAEWSRLMEAARQVALKPGATAEMIDAVFDGRAGFVKGDQFLKNMENGTYSKEHSFVPLFDRQLPREYDKIDYTQHAVDPDEEGTTSFLRTTGRLYYSQKGDPNLVDWQGAQAPTLDAYETLNRAFTNIASLSSFSDYKLTSVARWVHKFKDYIDEASVRPGATDMEKFLDGKMTKGGSRYKENIAEAFEDQRAIIKRNLGWKTPGDMKIDEVQRRFFEWTEGENPTSLRSKGSRVAQNWWENTNPIQSLRGMAFDLKLGLLNPVQLFLQAGTYLAIMAIDPVGATKAMASNPVLRHYLFRRSKPSDLEAHIKAGLHKVQGFDDPDEYRAFMNAAKSSGFFSINESHSLMNAMGPNTVLSMTGDKVQDVRQFGRVFFNEGELINRMTAYRVAWDRTFKKYGKDFPAERREEVLNEIFGEAEKFAFSMSRTSQAWWQQGLISIPTQFFAYQARMMEMMFGGVLKRDERIRLVLSQMILYGTSGIPLAGVLSDIMKGGSNAVGVEGSGDAPDINTAGGFIDRGFMDHLINWTTGADVLAGQRLGTGRFLGDTVGELFGFSKYGESNTMDVLGGATYSITESLLLSFKPFIKYMTAESGGETGNPVFERDLRNLANNISSVSNTMKYMMMANYGTYVTSKGKIQASGIPSENAMWTLLLGAAPSEQDEISARMQYFKNKGAVVDEAAKVFEQYRLEIVTYPDRADELSEEINAFSQMLPPDVRAKALEKAQRPPQSMMDSLDARMEKELADREQIKQMEKAASGQSN